MINKDVLKGMAVFGAIAVFSFSGGHASAPYLADELIDMKNELWRYKEALAGVIKKVISLDRRVTELELQLQNLRETGIVEEGKSTCRVTATWLRIRECPDLKKCKTIGLLRHGSVVEYDRTLTTDIVWRRIGVKGYVSAKYCEPLGE